jgi:hypothetical protein
MQTPPDYSWRGSVLAECGCLELIAHADTRQTATRLDADGHELTVAHLAQIDIHRFRSQDDIVGCSVFDTLVKFKATGKDWRARMSDVLEKAKA